MRSWLVQQCRCRCPIYCFRVLGVSSSESSASRTWIASEHSRTATDCLKSELLKPIWMCCDVIIVEKQMYVCCTSFIWRLIQKTCHNSEKDYTFVGKGYLILKHEYSLFFILRFLDLESSVLVLFLCQQLTPQNIVPLENLTDSHLVKSPVACGIWKLLPYS